MSRLRTNISYSIAYQILAIILPLVTAPYIARVLDVTGIGLYSYSFAIISNFQLFAMLGITNHGSRTIAMAQGRNEISQSFFEIYAIQIGMFILFTGMYLGYCFSCLCIDKHIALILSLFMLAGILDISWFFFGLEEFKLTVTRNAIFKLLTTVCVFIFVKHKEDIYLYAWIIAIGTLVCQLYLWFYLHRYIKPANITWSGIHNNMRPILVLFIPILSFSIYKIMSKILLGSIGNIDEVGFFENASKLLNVPLGFISAIGTVMLPRITTLLKEKNKGKVNNYLDISILANTIILSVIVFGLMSASSSLIDLFFGANFHRSVPMLRIMSISLLFVAWSNVIRTQWIIPHKYDKIYVYSTICGALLNLIFNILLIPYYGGIGAAISSVIAESSIWIFYVIAMKKMNVSLRPFICSFKYVTIGILMYVFLYYVFVREDQTSWLALLEQIILGGIFYFILAFFTLKHTDKKMFNLLFNHITWKKEQSQ